MAAYSKQPKTKAPHFGYDIVTEKVEWLWSWSARPPVKFIVPCDL